ncbi:MAG: AI-2E family transporter [Proteobacteria bacterium]|nr:AI-2E family transporter [Pseudomonadota bacterium]
MNTLQQSLLFVAILVSLGLLGAFIYHLSPVLTPFMIAAALAYLTDPLVERLTSKLKLPRTLAVTLVFLVVIFLFVIVLLVLIPALQQQIVALAAKIPGWLEWLQKTVMPELVAMGVVQQDLGIESVKSNLTEHMSQASSFAKWLWHTLFHSGLAIAEGFVHLFIIVIATFYLLRDWKKILSAINALLPTKYAPTIITIANQCDGVLSTFVRGQLSVMVALGSIYGLGLALIGVNFSLLLGMLAGLLSIVPYLGSIVGLGSALAVAYFQFHDIWHVGGVLALFGVGHILEGMVLTPLLIGDKLGLHPVVVIFAVLAGGHLLGFVGVVLALPITAILVVLLRELLHRLPNPLQQGEIRGS